MPLQAMRDDTSHQLKTEKPNWPDWSGMTAVCMATGPSLTASQVQVVKSASVRAIAINDMGLQSRGINAHWADIWYAADSLFWSTYEAQAQASSALKVCAERQPIDAGFVDLLLSVKADHEDKARQFMPGYAISGGHSGFQALQLAISLGASKVVLLGYDCKSQGNKTNYFGVKHGSLNKTSSYKNWPACYASLKLPEGVEVVNCTPGSAIKAYRFEEIGECLA